MNRRVRYLRGRDKRPVGCVVTSVERAMCMVRYQVTVLNPVDKFDRKLARQLALGRLVESPRQAVILETATAHDITKSVMTDIVASNDLPTRARKAAQLWLRSN